MSSASTIRSTASVTDSVPSTRRIGGPHGPSRSKIHNDQSRIAKVAMLAVTIKRRGRASRAGWEEIGVLGLDKILIKSHRSLYYLFREKRKHKQKAPQVERPAIVKLPLLALAPKEEMKSHRKS